MHEGISPTADTGPIGLLPNLISGRESTQAHEVVYQLGAPTEDEDENIDNKDLLGSKSGTMRLASFIAATEAYDKPRQEQPYTPATMPPMPLPHVAPCFHCGHAYSAIVHLTPSEGCVFENPPLEE